MRIQKFLSESPLFSLYVAYDQVLRDFQEKLAAENVHFIQALIITGLFFEDRAVRPSEFAHVLKVSRSNVSHALRDLEKKQIIDRSTDTKDARAYYISLTRAGKRMAPRLVKLFDLTQNEIETAGGKALNPQLKKFIETYRRIHFS